jgi:protein gp37
MMNTTLIAWTDMTSNPIAAYDKETGKRGCFCVQISEACRFCYAQEINIKFGNGLTYTKENIDKVRFELDEAELASWADPKYAGQLLFIVDMADIALPYLPEDYLWRISLAMLAAPGVTFQVLSKHPNQLAKRWRTPKHYDWLREQLGEPDLSDEELGARFDHVWIGTTIENNHCALARLKPLKSIPAKTRFVSFEPLLASDDRRNGFH